ncbi:MAG: FkbM family methyltransferase [Bacteroidetes bacterium]|nr:FkbM family methyltransferase [Bacteroidota bacterium]
MGTILKMPVSHSLPFNVAKFPTYSLNLSSIVNDCKLSENDIIIDVGANIGDTVALVRKVSNAQIICIEGDVNYFKYLQENTTNDKNITLIQSFVGENSQIDNTSLKIENGTARLVEDSNHKTEIKSLDDLLFDSLSNSKLSLIKIDTDGFDNKIIRGSKKLIEKHKPTLFFEYDPYFLKLNQEQGIDIFETLTNWGYTKFTFYDNLGEKICTCPSNQMNIIADLHEYFSGKRGTKYMDVVAYIV